MKVIKLLEQAPKIKKAGIIPYIISNNEIKMCFMITSDADYGGDQPMVAKGHIDAGETPLQAAIREGREELGLVSSNFKSQPFHVLDETITGYTSSYIMRVYGVEVKDQTNFTKPGYETKEVVWLTQEEYHKHGRKSQVMFVDKLISLI